MISMYTHQQQSAWLLRKPPLPCHRGGGTIWLGGGCGGPCSFIHTSPEIFHFIACGHFAYLAKYHPHSEICNGCIVIYRQQLPFMDLFRYPPEKELICKDMGVKWWIVQTWRKHGQWLRQIFHSCPGEIIFPDVDSTKTISTNIRTDLENLKNQSLAV